MASKKPAAVEANDFQVGGEHYKSAYQHWDWALDVEANPMQYQITKYLRARKKGGLEDMKKLKHFIMKYKEQRAAGRDYPPSRIKDFLRSSATTIWCKENGMDDLETEIALTVIMDNSVAKLGNLLNTVDAMIYRYHQAQAQAEIDKARGEDPGPAYVDQ